MTGLYQTSFVARVELWHGAILLALVAISRAMSWLDPLALLAGGIFMGGNFLLLGLGVRWLLSPSVSKTRQRVGACLLMFKLLLFLALISAAFFQLRLDGVSFAVGVSSLLLASLVVSLFTNAFYSMNIR